MDIGNLREVVSKLERLIIIFESGIQIDGGSFDSATETTLSTINTTLSEIQTLGIPSEVSTGGGHIANTAISNVTATQITITSIPCTKAYITAPSTNTKEVVIGFSTVTATTGVVLNPGESISFPVSNVNLLYAIAEVDGEDVSVTYFN